MIRARTHLSIDSEKVRAVVTDWLTPDPVGGDLRPRGEKRMG